MFITNWGVNHLAAYRTLFSILLGTLTREEVNVPCGCVLPTTVLAQLSGCRPLSLGLLTTSWVPIFLLHFPSCTSMIIFIPFPVFLAEHGGKRTERELSYQARHRYMLFTFPKL